MITIVFVQHALQQYMEMAQPHVAWQLVQRWREMGHRVVEHYGAENPPSGDVLFLHVDLTVVPAEYRALVPHYERAINSAVFDISKRRFSQILVDRHSGWDGPVIVKTDRNHYGLPEQAILTCAHMLGLRVDIPDWPVLQEYPIFRSLQEIPDEAWEMPGIVVEKFLPEMDARGFYLRSWHFFGDRERSLRRRASDPLVKHNNMLDQEFMPVPGEIRAWRERLGFDYGKFDYVVHDGQPILLDVNRTPAGAALVKNDRPVPGKLGYLAGGLEAFMRQKARSPSLA